MSNKQPESTDTKKDLTSFIYYENAVHDMKVPLSVVYTTVQLLQDMEEIPQDAKKHLEAAKNSCYKIMKLINDVSDFCKIDNGCFCPVLTNYNVVYLVRNITESTAVFANRKGIVISFKSNINKKIMATDKDMLERILLNLLSNAIKFTKPGGKVQVTLTDKDAIVEIRVKDNGMGINAEQLNAIFNRYVTSDAKIGSGVGLSIVNELTKVLGGSIKVKSTQNIKGSEFIIKLPVIVLKEIKPKRQFLDTFYSDNIVQIELSDYYY